ncbi:MAG: homocysteine S-methyltransferase family protein [Candidatus Hodarchaeales archaeon]|jgi:homocysteine S-methyltransferase
MNFEKTVKNSQVIITEGSLYERLNRDPNIKLNPFVFYASLIYETEGQEVLTKLYREYLDIGKKYNFPMIICTPTWRTNPIRLIKAGFKSNQEVNGDCYRFVRAIRDKYQDYANQIFIGGLIGCFGDAYNPEEALSDQKAFSFHKNQVKQLTESGVDFLIAQTLPAFSEAKGLAMAMAESGLPYILSFVLTRTGSLLDGIPLNEAISSIDSTVTPNPLCYLANCVHPSVFTEALTQEIKKSKSIRHRTCGLIANASSKNPEELEKLSYLETEDPDTFAEAMIKSHEQFNIKILGGCCGTDNRHIEGIAKRLYEAQK